MSKHKQNNHFRIGVDLGGTKIAIIALDEQGNTLAKHRTPTPQGDYLATIQAITTLVTNLESELDGQGSVGIATPGAISQQNGRMKNCNSTCLNGRPLQKDLEKALNRPVRMANDANCFALSEATDGAGAGAQCVFGVIIGTGTGAGIVINGQLLTGCNAIAGEWGHNPLPWPTADELPGPSCYCGQQGCLETFLSGPGFAAQSGLGQSAETIAEAAAKGHPPSLAALQQYSQRLARGLAHVINILDPEVIVLGGGMSNIESLYRSVPEAWQAYVFSDSVNTKLRPPRFGDDSGVRGAAWLWH